MSDLKSYLVTVVFLMNVFVAVESDCILSLKEDFGSPQPVLIQNGGLLAPKDGSVLVVRSETLLVACVGDGRYLVLGNETQDIAVAQAECVSGDLFRVDEWEGRFKDIRCNHPPWVSVERTGTPCYGGNEIVRVGYRVKTDFLPHYSACFNQNLQTTLYVRHAVDPASSWSQGGGRRPPFIDGGLFNTRVSNLYKLSNQKNMINSLLGDNKDQKYLSKKQFLTRGHLAPRGDFPLRSAQRASFQFVNAVPQWMRGNAGDWAALEEGIRRRVRSYGRQLTVYTGAYGVMTLPDQDGVPTELYLYADENNNLGVPVPMYLYKVIHDEEDNSATAFISINSSYYNATQLEELTFCENICEDNTKFKWLKWRSNDGTFSFCCEFNEFSEMVQHLTHLNASRLFF
ncbi:hypothetical protein JYU34_018171 [Plutella xylostella]|uniref:DNA/RNA non-specific endonuclease domain-containing protein n=1 Tax=Plutella xylostella TaxID=51655 RepID=A0ABQ7Q052_PLUXY|nr:hypothetical protein JYU34_018171 [Plutella xylostella]